MKKLLPCLVLLAMLAACLPAEPVLPTATPVPPALPTASPEPSGTPEPSATPVPLSSPTPRPTTQPAASLRKFGSFRVNMVTLPHPPIAEDYDHDEVWALLKPELISTTEDRSFKAQADRRLEETNDALTPFGYRLESKPFNGFQDIYYLYQGDQLVMEEWIDFFSPISVCAEKQDFTLMLDTSKGYQLLQKDGLHRQNLMTNPYTRFPPQYIGNALLSVKPDGSGSVTVLSDEEEIYSQAIKWTGAIDPLRLFMVLGEHWILETLDSIVIDGQVLNETQGYQASFGYTSLQGHAVYFFKRDGKIGLNLDGQELALEADDVPHDGCCSGATLNPHAADNWMGFFARQGEVWLYVEVMAPE